MMSLCSLGSQVGMSLYDDCYSVLVCICDNWKAGKCVEHTEGTLCSHGILCVFCKVMYMYVDGNECDNDCQDDEVISRDGSKDKQEVLMGKGSFEFYLY